MKIKNIFYTMVLFSLIVCFSNLIFIQPAAADTGTTATATGTTATGTTTTPPGGNQGDGGVEKVLCNVIKFVQGIGLPIMTGVIIGSSIMAIFGRLAWPAIVVLVVFTAIFFGAAKVMEAFVKGTEADSTYQCKS